MKHTITLFTLFIVLLSSYATNGMDKSSDSTEKIQKNNNQNYLCWDRVHIDEKSEIINFKRFGAKLYPCYCITPDFKICYLTLRVGSLDDPDKDKHQ